jgi:hypothetical protein
MDRSTAASNRDTALRRRVLLRGLGAEGVLLTTRLVLAAREQIRIESQ